VGKGKTWKRAEESYEEEEGGGGEEISQIMCSVISVP
jgi:hypothetical protein